MKNRKGLIAITMIASLFMTVSIAAYQSITNTVTIVDERTVSTYHTTAKTVKEVLDELDITLDPKDEVTPSLDSSVKNETNIVIDRWKPTVRFTIDGQMTTFETDLETVQDVVELKGLLNKEGVTVEPALTTPITDQINIIVTTTQVVEKIVEESVPFKTKEKYTLDLKPGETKVSAQGKEGLKQKVVKVVTVGGKVVEKTVVSETIVTEPIDEIVLVGQDVDTIIDPSTGKKYEYVKEYTMEATAYTNGPGSWGITASGSPTFLGMVAVDPKVIPLGTRLYVEDYGIAIAGDTGGAIKGNKIDIFLNSKQECYNFGRRNKKVYVLKDQSIDVVAARK